MTDRPDAVPPQGFPRPTRRKGKRSVAWRQDPEILARVADVDRRRLQGETIAGIATALGIDEWTVKLDRRRATLMFRERIGGDVAEQRNDAVRLLEGIAQRAIAAYEHDLACERAVLFGDEVDGRSVRYDDKGSARFSGRKDGALNVARQALMDIAKLQGLVVEKVAPTDADGNTLTMAQVRSALGIEPVRSIRDAPSSAVG